MSETINPQGNPQGKGVVMVLQQMAAAAPAEIRPKSADEALLDYWCSSLFCRQPSSFGLPQTTRIFSIAWVPNGSYHLLRPVNGAPGCLASSLQSVS